MVNMINESVTMDNNSVQHLPVTVPVMDRERFAELVGVAPGVVQGWINKGYLPTIAVGKYSLVNVSLLQVSCLQREFS